jgi:hypothetical protein
MITDIRILLRWFSCPNLDDREACIGLSSH